MTERRDTPGDMVRTESETLEYVIDVADFEEGDRVHIDARGEEITVFNVDGDYHALLNYCPHQKGPLCEGPLSGTLSARLEERDVKLSYDRKARVVACPWHGWEFDVTTGELLANRNVTVPRYRTVVENEKLYVDIGSTIE